MARIHNLKIKNFRGIKEFEHTFQSKSFVCLIGRGDAGKSTILYAISSVLSSKWDQSFFDSDFYNGNTDSNIEIEVSLTNLPGELLSDNKFGLHKRLLRRDNTTSDNLEDEGEDLLTIRLVVDKSLEPVWMVINEREKQDAIEIRASDRQKLNVHIISDYIDRHFTWGKGTPLYTLLKRHGEEINKDNLLVDAHRKVYSYLKENLSYTSDVFKDVMKNVGQSATSLGLSGDNFESYVDFVSLLMKEGNISLHDNDIPLRLNGKGTKRLLSIAIQMEIAKEGGIILIDEIEQGLEPDRVKHLVNELKKSDKGQFFITTHSNNVLVELKAEDIFLKRKESNKLVGFDTTFQKTLRINPNAFFAKRVIVCEGATEIGIMRSFNQYRKVKEIPSLEIKAISLVDGKGSELSEQTLKFKEAGFDTSLFCDSDCEKVDKEKPSMRELNIEIADCEDNLAFEEQIFKDLNWENVINLLKYAINEGYWDSMCTKLSIKKLSELEDTPEIRKLIGESAKDRGWYKTVAHGEELGRVWSNSIEEMSKISTPPHLYNQYQTLMRWIDKEEVSNG